MQAGLYEQLLTMALQQDLEGLADPRLYTVAPVDAEDAHAAIAQFLEHILVGALATFRGSEAGERPRWLIDRMVAALTEELGAGLGPSTQHLDTTPDADTRVLSDA